VRIHYDVVGKGEPLVLQHGSPQDGDDWRQSGYVGPLSERYRVVLIDARGHGRIDRTHYWGYSFGGWIGLGLLVKTPQRLRKAVLGGVHPYERKTTPYQSDGSNPEEFMRDLSKRMGLEFDSLPAELRKKLLQFDCRALVANQRDRASHEAFLPGIRTPCLMYAGDKDGLYEQARKGAAAIPGCAFVTVPGAHVPAFNNSAAILPHVLKFLAE
jgi:pimeloyl-ACP methyl ester carboxylesterase